MSNNNEKPLHLGTRQCDRFPSALSKDYVKIDERSFNDLIQQMSEYAKKVNFYNDDNPDKADGHWEPFFKEIYDYETQSIKLRTLQKQMNEGTVPPHLSLLLSFLKLYQIEQNNLNRLTERHLEFYYKNVLGFTPRIGKVGNAVVFVSPVKNTSSVIIPKGTLFDAGKDSKGKTILFESTDEVTINKAQVNDCYYSHRFDNGNYDIETLQIQSRTQDSVETNSNDTIQETINLNFGFAIAISSFLEAKNQKNIDLGSLEEKIDLKYFTAEYTSINGWEKIEYSSQEEPTADLNSEKKDKPLRDNESDNQEKNHYFLKIDGVMHPMIPYNPKLHGEGYNSNNPIIRFLPANAQDSRIIDSKKNELWNVLNIKHDSFNNIRLREIESTDNLIIENKYGMVNNVAGSSPFGYICQKKDYFSVKINIPSREFYSNLNDDTYTINLNINDLGINDLLKKESNMKLEYPVIQYTLKNDDRRIDKRINKFLNSKEDETYEDYETDEEFETDPTYSLILESASETTIQAIRLMKEMTGLGLDVATQMIDETPITIKENVDETTAENIMGQFEKVGATVEITSNSKTSRIATRRAKKAKKNEDNPETKFNVILKSAGASKVQIVKLISDSFGIGLKEAKDLVDSAPITIKENIDKETAEDIKKQLEDAGATVEITSNSETFNVILNSIGENTIQLIKLIEQYTNLGLKESIDIIENTPYKIITGIEEEPSIDIKYEFEGVGAVITRMEDVYSNITEEKDDDESDPTNPYTTFELKKAISYNSNILIPTQKMELFTIAPWGINKIDPQDGNKSDSKESDDAANYIFQDAKFPPLKYIEGEEESGVFIAISGISQPTCLNIYFELGSYNINKQIIKWSYLSAENKWKEFSRKNVCKDGTENFSKNGIVQLYLNKEVFRIKDDIPADKIWLYVSTQKTDGQKDTKLDDFLHKIKYIQTQAVEVSFSEESVGTLQNEICLPQGSITKLIKSITGIKKVEQPFDGFVGIASETTDEFNCRVSEKLRHKGKAWTSWDYERILLERFPQLAAVRCVPCSSDDSGTVKIVVFPNVSLIPQGDIRKPQIDAFTKNEIEHYLKTICSPFVNIEILNPSYKEVDITGKITLRKEYHDHTYYLKLIEEALTNYLAPWRSNPMNISLTTHTPKNLEIQYFLEKLEYVDFIKELSVDSKSLNEEELTIITYNSIEITID